MTLSAVLVLGCGSGPVVVSVPDAGPPEPDAPRIELVSPTSGSMYDFTRDDLDQCLYGFGPVRVRARVRNDPFHRVVAIDFRSYHCTLDPAQHVPHIAPVITTDEGRFAEIDLVLTCLSPGTTADHWIEAHGLSWETGLGVGTEITAEHVDFLVTIPADARVCL